MRSGALLLKSENDRYVEAPLVATDVDLVVSGPTARARVTQIFHNPTDGWVEAVYVYPLPEGGAVDTLKMVIGDRIIVGDIKERKQARETYEQAKSAGQKTSLVEQERPNIFTNSVANIGPRETVVVQIEYQEPVRQSGNEFSLRVPLVVAPRYIPAPIVQTVELGAGGRGWGRVVDPVPDRDRIAPPVLDPRKNIAGQPGRDHRAPAGRLPARRGEEPSPRRQDRDRRGRRPPDQARRGRGAGRSRLRADLEAGGERQPSVGLFRERVGDADYLLAFVTPPVLAASEEAAAARDRLRHRQFRLHGRHVDRAGQGEPRLCARPARAIRPLQRHPVRQHHGRAVPRHGGGRRRACRAGQGVRVGARGPRRHRDGAADAGGADRPARQRRQRHPPGDLPDRRRDRQRAAAVRDDRRHARALAHLHGRHRLGAQLLPDDARRRARARHLHPYRLGGAGRGAHADPVREAREPGRDQSDGDVLRRQRGCHAGGAPRSLSRRAAGRSPPRSARSPARSRSRA